MIKYLDKKFKLSDIKMIKKNTIKDIHEYLINNIPKPDIECNILKNSYLIIDDCIPTESTQINDIKDFEYKAIVLEINLRYYKDNEYQEDLDLRENLCPLELLPKLTRPGYKISPSLIEISRMTIEEVKNIPNFFIWNDFGKIQWIGEIDLLEVNLDLDVHIKPECVEVYPEDIYLTEKKKPELGHKLNKPSYVTLYNI